MTNFDRETENKKFTDFQFSMFEEYPDDCEVYMDKLISILDKSLAIFQIPKDEKIITSTMVNNYVKYKVIPAPNKKKYSKIHMRYLFVIGILKSVLSIGEVATLIQRQMEEYPLEVAFNFFVIELANALKVTFGDRDFALANSEKEKTPLSKLVRSALLSFANKIYVKFYLHVAD